MGPKRVAAITLALAAAILTSACTSGDDNVRAPLPSGEAKAATGTPITVGLINTEGSPIGSFPEIRRAVEAATTYVNEELGGVSNHPIHIESCVTDGTQALSQACATRLVGTDPLIVLGGVDLAAGVPILILGEAGIPYMGAAPILGRELTHPGSFMVAGGAPGDLLAMAKYATQELNATSMGVVYVDLPGLLDEAMGAAERVLGELGVTELRIIAEKPDAADFVPALSAATEADPDVILAAFDGRGCIRMMQARQALGITIPLLLPSPCVSEEVLTTAGSAADGVYLASAFLPYDDTSDPEVALYREKLARYGDEDDVGALSQAGFSLMMTLHRVLSDLDEDSLRPDAVWDALAAADNLPGFMSHSFTCDGKQVIAMRAVCNHWVRLMRHHDGELTDVTGGWVTGASLLELLLS